MVNMASEIYMSSCVDMIQTSIAKLWLHSVIENVELYHIPLDIMDFDHYHISYVARF
jgi:hypothetical protein